MLQLRMRARPGGFLYDCHSRSFAVLDHGHNIAGGFLPLYLSRLFGVRMVDWPAFLARAQRDLDALSPAAAEEYLRAQAPRVDPRRAVDFALLVYPTAGRFIELHEAEGAPFVLRDEFLWQPNVPLATLEGRDQDGHWRTLATDLDSDPSRLHAVRNTLAHHANGGSESGADPLAQFLAARTGTPGTDTLPPGLYLLGHSSLLVRSRNAGVLIDPVLVSSLARAVHGWSLPRLRPLIDGTLLTHTHFDHYHVPTLLALSNSPLVVPPVSRASVVCEDVAARLVACGAPEVRRLQWGTETIIGDVRIRALPFIGEQFLTSEVYPEARNWGNCYLLEADGMRILVVGDSGFEPDRSILDVVRDEVAARGPIDMVVTQAIGLRTTFGHGDPDLLLTGLTCASRASEALALLRYERRVTLAVDDLPALCLATAARYLVLYGQFSFERGDPSVAADILSAARAAISEAGLKTVVAAPHVGDGIDGNGRPLTLND